MAGEGDVCVGVCVEREREIEGGRSWNHMGLL